MDTILLIVVGIVALALGLVGGYFYRRNIAEAKIGKAEEAVRGILDDARKKAESHKKRNDS